MKKRFLFIGLIAALIAGCQPGGAEYVDELDLVLTTYEKTYDFGAAQTFEMPDQIPKPDGNPNAGGIVYLDQDQADIILAAIKSNMEARGYTETLVEGTADIRILPAVVTNTTIVTYCDYYGGYWGWWGGYPGYGGCYYPSAYAYTTGSVLINMVDGDDATDVVNVWGAVANGLVSGSTSSINTRVQNAIDQAFIQSPYIQSN